MSYVVYDEAKAKAAGATENEEILYVLQVADLKETLNIRDIRWDDLPPEQQEKLKHTATKYLESFNGEGTYTWADALRDAIDEAMKGNEG